MKVVLQKFIADSGCCSRRKAEELIRESMELRGVHDGETFKKTSLQKAPVLVNGELPELGMRVDHEDEVLVHGKKIGLAKKHIYIILNKPVGYVCTNRFFKDEKNIFELIDLTERLFAVGRLDKNSRGLVLLTNDGELAEKLSHPRYGHEKEYKVMVENGVMEADEVLARFREGIDIREDDGKVKVKKISCAKSNIYNIVLTEGKKRQIRRMFGVLGIEVYDLKRIRIGSLELGDLKEGTWRDLEKKEINSLSKNRV
jgi:pseudouridine synthase